MTMRKLWLVVFMAALAAGCTSEGEEYGFELQPGPPGADGPQGPPGPTVALDKDDMYTIESNTAALHDGWTHLRMAQCLDDNDILMTGGCHITWREEPEYVAAALTVNHSSRPVNADSLGEPAYWECNARGWGPVEVGTRATMKAVAVCMWVD